ncbi:mfs superfamily major facilitator transporter [Klebsiella pneumoniae]|uniref:C4-dicarboxylate ABC transporter n=2 Tax=Klebsiella/Raoultella group TaxID=2890311 RepID=A0A2J5A173_9ENTR|nr:YfcC family protein [Klebsiella pneumoniae]PLM69022.1 C4-dicarboxylate ABC transporter [Klebsiella michiganensis]HBU7061602.1 YfcC family protein [Klebsiella oxytoca]HBX3661472.1 YfcC family protein [Klebsiella pneumoniae subsp. pneumoniae]EJO2888193.1 YfcC family protein [Klebsiella pneumoniae]MBC4207020.1 YfcC family protein [Klebsiella pneumoniae]
MSQYENDAAPAVSKAWRFPSTYTVLIAITAVVWLLTWVIPAGHYQTQDGRPVAGSFEVAASPLTADQRVKELFLAPVNGLYGIENAAGHVGPYESGSVFGAIGVFFYVLSLGAFIVTTTKTGAIDACLGHVAQRFRRRGGLLIAIVMLLIAIGGSTYGMGEETLGFYALLVPLLLGLGFDRMTAVGVILVGSVVGNMNSTVNPFMTGAASAGAGVPMGSGIGLRFVMFLVLTGLAIGYVVIYARRVQRDTARSVVGFTDEDRTLAKAQLQLPQPMTRQQKAVMLAFAGTFAFMIFAIIPWAQVIVGPQAASWSWQLDWYFPELTALFLVMSVVTGLLGGMRGNTLYNAMLAGIADFMGAALVIVLARGITVIMHNAQITDTVLHSMESVVSGASSGLFAIMMYLIIMPLSFLVPSSSGLATLAMPVLAPIADFAGVGREMVVTAYQCSVGTIAMISPTSAIVMSGLALAKVSYPRYLMWVLPLLALLAVATCLFLVAGAALS